MNWKECGRKKLWPALRCDLKELWRTTEIKPKARKYHVNLISEIRITNIVFQ
jgi:hypothetical protein